MSEQQNLDVVRRAYEAFGKGDIPGLLSLFDPSITWTTPGPPDVPTAGTRKGPQAVAEFFQTLNATFEIQRFETREFFAQGDRVVVIGDDTSRVKATGKAIEFAFVHIFTVRNGKVVAFEERADTSAVVDELRKAQART